MKGLRNLLKKILSKNAALTTLFKPSASTAKMIRRELVADIIQNPLKGFAAYQSGSHAVFSELMRAFIDFLNHLVMLGADIKSRKPPNDHYNYGKI
jgi:divalent metal cation (Fe/Co/Zn/Cd) transporter